MAPQNPRETNAKLVDLVWRAGMLNLDTGAFLLANDLALIQAKAASSAAVLERRPSLDAPVKIKPLPVKPSAPVRAAVPPPAARHLALVREMQAALSAGLVKNRADVARRFGVTRPRVTQLFALLSLPDDVQVLLDGRPLRTSKPITERWLRILLKESGPPGVAAAFHAVIVNGEGDS